MPFALLARFGAVALGSLGLDRVVSWFHDDADAPAQQTAVASAAGMGVGLVALLLSLALAGWTFINSRSNNRRR